MRIRLFILGCMVAVTCFSQKNIFPHSGTLIIIGGGSMPDTMYQAFEAKTNPLFTFLQQPVMRNGYNKASTLINLFNKDLLN
jgi:hypothetical protein